MFFAEPKRKEPEHEDFDRVLHTLKLLAPGHQFGGKDQKGIGHRNGTDQKQRRRLRSESGRQAHLLQAGARALPGAQRDSESAPSLIKRLS